MMWNVLFLPQNEFVCQPSPGPDGTVKQFRQRTGI